MVYQYLISIVEKGVTTSMVKDLFNQIKWTVYRTTPSIESDYIALNNKVLNLKTLEYSDFDRQKVAFFKFPFNTAEVQTGIDNTPLFRKFLNEVLVDKKGEQDVLLQILVQEMFGYYLLNTNEAHCTFFFVGDGQNGKSVLLNILRKMIGEDFCSAMSIETLTTNRFATSTLIDKKINICLEEESTYIKADKFKALVGGDPVQAERKFGETFTMIPSTKFIFATNEMPTFSGLNYGLVRRIKIIPFNKRIEEEKKDTKLTEKLCAELPGIFGWALEGAKRLIANEYHFTVSLASNEKSKEFQQNISSAVLFFNETFEESADGFIALNTLYSEYTSWCEAKGKKKLNFYNVMKDIDRVSNIKEVVGWDDGGQAVKGRRLIPKTPQTAIDEALTLV